MKPMHLASAMRSMMPCIEGTACFLAMVTISSIVQRLDLLNCDVALDPDGTEAAHIDLTMTLKVRQYGLSAPAVVTLESRGVDLE